ncbi:DUF3658 domain-containing protein [Chitinophaga varians]|uniref:DUF3658 domain-containing protein n=1 Tax=Chitinophaga varians TaxID=2202339 RepID=UPI00165F4A1B|nr:DUF3658 domain-containing protein [Chitinophaga varians]MBC9913373.1 DUF1835 domain-containing protein [Chitinophaga varians]
MSDLHLTASPTASAALSSAIKKQLLTGDAYAINDIPGTGPLHDGLIRKEFQRSLHYEKKGTNWSDDGPDAFAPWIQLKARLVDKPVDRLVIWAASGNGDDYVFLRMACHWLENIPVNVILAEVPPIHGHHSIIMYSTEQLAPLIEQAIPLTTTARAALAREYQAIVSHPGQLRECDENGVLQFLDLSAHDHEVLARCTNRWKSAVSVIGQVMGFSNPRNSLGDAFISSRLEHLIITGQVAADAPRTSIRDFRVKLAQKTSVTFSH